MKVFKSKVDKLLGTFLVLLVISPVVQISLNFQTIKTTEDWLGIAVHALVSFMVALTVLSLRYTIEGERLIIRAGFYRKTIRLRDITKVTKAIGYQSAPALSAERLNIEYRLGQVQVSPDSQAKFLQAIGFELTSERVSG